MQVLFGKTPRSPGRTRIVAVVRRTVLRNNDPHENDNPHVGSRLFELGKRVDLGKGLDEHHRE